MGGSNVPLWGGPPRHKGYHHVLALSVRQPWTHAIVNLLKDIENRGRLLGHRGLTLLHASAGMTPEEYRTAEDFMRSRGLLNGGLPPMSALERGGIVGVVEIVDSVKEHPSRWWMGPCGLVLRNARPLPFIPCAGTVAPLFWTPDGATMERVRAAL